MCCAIQCEARASEVDAICSKLDLEHSYSEGALICRKVLQHSPTRGPLLPLLWKQYITREECASKKSSTIKIETSFLGTEIRMTAGGIDQREIRLLLRVKTQQRFIHCGFPAQKQSYMNPTRTYYSRDLFFCQPS